MNVRVQRVVVEVAAMKRRMCWQGDDRLHEPPEMPTLDWIGKKAVGTHQVSN